MKDGIEILMIGAAAWFGVLCINAFVNRPQPIAMEAEDRTIEPSYAPDLADLEATEPRQLPPMHSIVSAFHVDHSPLARASAAKPEPAPSIDPVQPIVPAMAKSPKPEPLTYFWTEDLNEAQLASQERGLPIFLYFTQPGCIPCGLVKQFALKNGDVRKFLEANYVLAWVNVAKETEIAATFGVKTTPQAAIWNPASPEFKLWTPESEPNHFLTDLRRMREQYDKEQNQ